MFKNKKGNLYVVGLPIGNLKDISYRTEEYLKVAKNIVTENEINFINFLKKININRNDLNIISIEAVEGGKFYEFERIKQILELLNNGEDIYIVSDEGMPGVADPGQDVIRKAIENGIDVLSTPGPSIAIAASTVTGTGHNFLFDSFLPREKDIRKNFLINRKNLHVPMILVLRNSVNDGKNNTLSNEIPELLDELCVIFEKDRKASLCYNLTTKNEKVVRGTVEFLKKYFNDSTRDIRDQITIVIDIKNGNMPI
jgi:16S rRNA (cytidine1402-2'-O)-methyltransferase